MAQKECIFCRIARGEVPSEVLYRDDRVFVVRDIRPRAPVHLLIIPLRHIAGPAYITPESEPVVGHLFTVAEEMARREGLGTRGYRLTVNVGPDAGQEVHHLHMHLLGGRALGAMG